MCESTAWARPNKASLPPGPAHLSPGRCKHTLEGHENGTCVLGLPNGYIAVGSTGRKDDRNQHVDYKLRMWRQAAAPGGGDGPWSVERVIEDHDQAIRDLALLRDGAGFVSVGNDGAVKLRDLTGAVNATFYNPMGSEGKPFSAFRVSVAPNGDVLTCNEDCVVRLYAWASINGARSDWTAEELVHPGKPRGPPTTSAPIRPHPHT